MNNADHEARYDVISQLTDNAEIDLVWNIAYPSIASFTKFKK